MALLGYPKVGKTTAVAALIPHFNIRYFDYDDGLAPLIKECKKRRLDMDRVQYQSLRDKYTNSEIGPILAGPPIAFPNTLKFLDKWPDDGSKCETLGPDYICIFDGGTFLARAAWNWSKYLSNATTIIDGLAAQKGDPDPRTVYQVAQIALEKLLAMLTADSFHCNVLVIFHLQEINGKLFPKSLGTALSPIIPTYFNQHILMMERTGAGESEKRIIRTRPTSQCDLMTSADVNTEIDAYDGLSLFFKRP